MNLKKELSNKKLIKKNDIKRKTSKVRISWEKRILKLLVFCWGWGGVLIKVSREIKKIYISKQDWLQCEMVVATEIVSLYW